MTPAGIIEAASGDADHFFGMAALRPAIRLQDIVHPDDIDYMRRKVEHAAKVTAGRASLSVRLRRHDGAYRQFEGQLLNHAAAGSGRITLNVIDVSRRADTERQLSSLLEGSVQGLVVHRGVRPLFCNSALAEMVEMETRADVLREPSILPFLYEEDRDRVLANIQARLAGEDAPSSYEFRLRARSGRIIWVDCRASVVEWQGEPAVLAACFDITDRKRAEEARRKSEELFTRVFEISPDFMSLTRVRDGVYLNVNDSFLSRFGYRRDELIGKSAFDLNIWASLEDRKRVLGTLEAGDSVRNMEVRGRTKAGEEFHVLLAAEILDLDGEDILMIVGHDISQRKADEAELRASKEAAELANRSKSDFLANMSHELRTPLNAILGFSEIIKNQLHGRINEPKYAEYARDIHESGAHLLEIINDILDLSKVEAGRLEVHEQEVSIPEVAANCRRLIEPRVLEAGVALRVDVPDDLPTLMADERLMKQILLNLLSNAVKFTPKGGRIGIRANMTDKGSLSLSVTDTGIGMDEVGIERALKPFGQVDTSFSRKHQGSGLGLPLVVAFTERQGGCFDLDSTVGEGTRVTVTFPADRLVVRP